jgi:hypothetical protein
MSTSRKRSLQIGDVEKSHPTVADSLGADEAQPIAVRLGDLWTDFIRVAEDTREPDGRSKAGPAVPILDDMKGILQWD